MKKTAILMTALLLTTTACANLTGGGDDRRTYRVGAIWLSDNQVYIVRDSESGKEVWRRDGDQETFVVRGAEIPGTCGSVDFLFDAGGRLGIALECTDDTERLVAYTPTTGTYQTLFNTPGAAEVTMQADGLGGYISTGLNGCWALTAFGQTPPGALTGTKRFTCDQGGSAKAPHLLSNGDLLFVATDSEPAQRPVRDENRTWRIYRLTPGESEAHRIGPDLVGFPEMDVSPDGKTAVVSVWGKDAGSLVAIDLTTGADRRLAEFDDSVTSPAVSPTGDQVMYVDDLRKIRTVKLHN